MNSVWNFISQRQMWRATVCDPQRVPVSIMRESTILKPINRSFLQTLLVSVEKQQTIKCFLYHSTFKADLLARSLMSWGQQTTHSGGSFNTLIHQTVIPMLLPLVEELVIGLTRRLHLQQFLLKAPLLQTIQKQRSSRCHLNQGGT